MDDHIPTGARQPCVSLFTLGTARERKPLALHVSPAWCIRGDSCTPSQVVSISMKIAENVDS